MKAPRVLGAFISVAKLLQGKIANLIVAVENLKATPGLLHAQLDALFASIQRRKFRGEL